MNETPNSPSADEAWDDLERWEDEEFGYVAQAQRIKRAIQAEIREALAERDTPPDPEPDEDAHLIDRLGKVHRFLKRVHANGLAEIVEKAAGAIEALETDRDWKAAKEAGIVESDGMPEATEHNARNAIEAIEAQATYDLSHDRPSSAHVWTLHAQAVRDLLERAEKAEDRRDYWRRHFCEADDARREAGRERDALADADQRCEIYREQRDAERETVEEQAERIRELEGENKGLALDLDNTIDKLREMEEERDTALDIQRSADRAVEDLAQQRDALQRRLTSRPVVTDEAVEALARAHYETASTNDWDDASPRARERYMHRARVGLTTAVNYMTPTTEGGERTVTNVKIDADVKRYLNAFPHCQYRTIEAVVGADHVHVRLQPEGGDADEGSGNDRSGPERSDVAPPPVAEGGAMGGERHLARWGALAGRAATMAADSDRNNRDFGERLLGVMADIEGRLSLDGIINQRPDPPAESEGCPRCGEMAEHGVPCEKHIVPSEPVHRDAPPSHRPIHPEGARWRVISAGGLEPAYSLSVACGRQCYSRCEWRKSAPRATSNCASPRGSFAGATPKTT